tara:strand:+ start:201 stop:530 length:330 start_codon:yes stop_codon:yes gene_type:complete
MRILFLLLVTLFISPTFAQVDERNICYITDADTSLFGKWEPTIPKECKVGNILVVWKMGSVESQVSATLTRLASQYCNYEKQIKIESAYLSCELARKTPRKNINPQTDL